MTVRTHSHHQALVIALSVAGLAALAVLLLAPDAHAALTGFSGGGQGKGGFAKVYDFFDKLGKALIPLSIPLGVIGTIGAGGLFLLGSQQAGKIIGGVVAGLALILFGPSIIA